MHSHMNINRPELDGSPSAYEKKLQKALAEREQFLRRQPHLRSFQAEIDRVLEKSGNHEGRMAVLGMLLQSKLLEMQKELRSLAEILQTAVESH